MNDTDRNLKQNIKIITLMLFVLLLIFFSVFSFLHQVRRIQMQTMEQHLSETLKRNNAFIKNVLQNHIAVLESAALTISKYENLKSPEVLLFLDGIFELKKNDTLELVFDDGSSVKAGNKTLSFPDLPLDKNLYEGAVVISDVVFSDSDNVSAIDIYTPIYIGGKKTAVLHLILTYETLSKEFAQNFYNAIEEIIIIDKIGNIVAYSSPEGFTARGGNFFLFADNFSFLDKNYSLDKLRKDFNTKTYGRTDFLLNGKYMNAYYEPVGISGWIMISIVPETLVYMQASEHIKTAFWLLLNISFIMLAVFVFIYINQRNERVKASLNEQCVHVLAEYTGKIIVEWDFDTRRISTTTNFEKLFGKDFIAVNENRVMFESDLVHPEDQDLFKNISFAIVTGESINDSKFRVRDKNDMYHWFTFSCVVVKRNNGKLFKSIGFLENIDARVRNESALFKKATTDNLTGLYNKDMAENLMVGVLGASDEKCVHAFLCVDLDNFKGVNDSFGHLFGDTVLIEAAHVFKSLFRSTDVIGRFGGDEFMMLIRDIPSIDFIINKVAAMNELLYKTYTIDGVVCETSVSVGVALYPKHGTTYEELYEKADAASYEAKRSGKNTFRFPK